MAEHQEATLATYRVTITSELLTEPLVIDLVATSPERAKRRAGMTAMHMYHCAELMGADTTADWLHDGPPRDDD